MTQVTKIKVEATVNAPLTEVWKVWNTPADIMQWNSADPSWHCPHSENNLTVGGKFNHRMEARDGSFGFDFEGVYNKIEPYKEITYTMSDGRQATTLFSEHKGKTHIETIFDGDKENDPEFQKQGWQAILNNFVKYTETNSL